MMDFFAGYHIFRVIILLSNITVEAHCVPCYGLSNSLTASKPENTSCGTVFQCLYGVHLEVLKAVSKAVFILLSFFTRSYQDRRS